MEDKKLKKIGVAAVSASVLTAGTIAFAAAYQSGTAFDPSGSNRDLKTNQVVFSDNDDSVGHKKDSDKKESEMLNKDQNEQQKNRAKLQNQADYLFDSNVKFADNSANSAMINDGNDNTSSGNLLDNVAQTPGSKPGTILDITGDASNADVILPGGNGTGTGVTGNNGNNGTGGTGGNGSGTGTGTGGTGGNNGGSTTTRPADTVKDPEEGKISSTAWGPGKPYPDTVKPEDIRYIYIGQPYNGSDINLYKGQLVDEKKLYGSLETCIMDANNVYSWGTDAFNKYIRITGISFDGGNTWITEFPVTIPKDIEDGQMIIRVEYRLNLENENWTEQLVDYNPQESCIYLLSEKLQKNSSIIDASKLIVMNTNDKYSTIGSKVPLLYYQERLFQANQENETLTKLFPGWLENDELVPWFYPVESLGRHILEPADMVPLSDDYTVKIKNYYLTEDYKYNQDFGELSYLQTLENYSKSGMMIIQVPKYVQAVDIDDDANLSVEYFSIPDTVWYVNGGSRGIKVNQRYCVDKNNLNYAVSENGILTNKEGNEYEAIPYIVKKLEVPSSVSRVNLSGSNQVEDIIIDAETIDQLPKLEFERPADFWGNKEEPKEQQCKVVLKDSLLDQFALNNLEELTNNDIRCLASKENPDVMYNVEYGNLLVNNRAVRKVLETQQTTLQFEDDIESIGANAFDLASSVKRIIMPSNGNVIEMKDNCFANSKLETIFCYNKEQYDYITENLGRLGAPEKLHVEIFDDAEVSREGYTYRVVVDENGVNGILVKAPGSVKEFDGTVTTKEGSKIEINSIAEDAFANCKELVWVFLPESIHKIGTGAFNNCTSLQGVLINTNQYIYIGDKSFDNCSSLRFIGSNAMQAERENDYDPLVEQIYNGEESKFFYVPTDSTGYAGNSIAFTWQSGVCGYSMEDIGNGCKMLYGLDYNGRPNLGLRSGTDVGKKVVLPDSTTELFDYALADTKSASGSYQVNWEELTNLRWLDTGAFLKSDLEEVRLNQQNIEIDSNVFYTCKKLTSVELLGSVANLGMGAFVNCENLNKVTLGECSGLASIPYNLFGGCDSLSDLIIDSSTAYPVTLYDGFTEFTFNNDWGEQEAQKLHIQVPKDKEEQYIKKWRYAFAGYTGSASSTAYLNMWYMTKMNLFDRDTFEYPAEEVVDEAVEKQLLSSENKIRKMFSCEQVNEPIDYYPYHESSEGFITLIGAPNDCENVTLDKDTLELLEGWSLDYIGKEAFSKSKNLKNVHCLENLVGIYSEAFKGVESNSLTLEFDSAENPPQLILEEVGIPFEFGVEDSCLHIKVPEGSEQVYIDSWSYPLLGYWSRDALENAVMTEIGAESTDDLAVQNEVNKRILPCINRVRGWLGLEAITLADLKEPEEATETEPTTPAESGDIQNPEQSSESGTGTGDADTSGDNTGNAGDEATEDDTKDEPSTDGNISGDNKTEDKSQTGTIEQGKDVKKEESNSGSQN